MKSIVVAFLTLFLASTFSSCGIGISYVGDNWAPTNNIEVFYDARDVNRAYKVIGHISATELLSANDVKQKIVQKAKAVGSDAVIIKGKGQTGTDSQYYADAIKYTD